MDPRQPLTGGRGGIGKNMEIEKRSERSEEEL